MIMVSRELPKTLRLIIWLNDDRINAILGIIVGALSRGKIKAVDSLFLENVVVLW